MDKLRHIHGKIGTETAWRIPVSVEDAIAEAMEVHDALKSEYDLIRLGADLEVYRGDELAARVERLESELDQVTRALRRSFSALPVRCADEIIATAESALRESPAASLLLHDAQVIRDVADKLTRPPFDDSFYKGYDRAILDVRAAADALEGEGDE
jgi:alkanesulfonate monooxygenase SsuD/methylene tetrahydromethanopterin reductase-like flavin-dependent oxidoreductase (luciferase family)